MKSEIRTAIIFGIAIAVAIGILSVGFSFLDEEPSVSNIEDVKKIDKSRFKMAPDLVGIANYLNTTPEQLEKEIEGKIVLYDIWTYSCINCIRTLPYITAWDDKYSDQGLLIIGIHTPEFEFEKDPENVKMAINKHGINYPVVLDNDRETWVAFENSYWPRKYVADHEGYIRYDHIGEGKYQETERVIQMLLRERSEQLGLQKVSATSMVDIEEFEHSVYRTPELYFGYYFAQNRNQLGSDEGFQPGQIVNYSEPEEILIHRFYPVGEWKNHAEGMELISDTGSIKVVFEAKEVNIVTSNDAEMEIFLDNEKLPPQYIGKDVVDNNILKVSEPGLYNIINSETSSFHTLELQIKGKGFQIFTFTFG